MSRFPRLPRVLPCFKLRAFYPRAREVALVEAQRLVLDDFPELARSRAAIGASAQRDRIGQTPAEAALPGRIHKKFNGLLAVQDHRASSCALPSAMAQKAISFCLRLGGDHYWAGVFES